MGLTPWIGKHVKVAPGSDEEAALLDWQHEIEGAIRHRDPSRLALKLAHGRVPPALRGYLYRLICAAPWRDARAEGGRRRKLNAVDEIGIIDLYELLTRGFAVLHGRRPSRAAIIDELCRRYGVSKSTVERVLSTMAASPKPPGVLRPRPRR